MRQHKAAATSARSPMGGTTGRSDKESKRKRNEWRITKMVLAIFLSFLICYLPITIVKIADKQVHSPGNFNFKFILLFPASSFYAQLVVNETVTRYRDKCHDHDTQN
jgi:hypothetical protein